MKRSPSVKGRGPTGRHPTGRHPLGPRPVGPRPFSPRWSLIIIFLSITLQNIFPQSDSPLPDYRQIFGKDYEWAENKIARNHWWADTLQSHGIDPHPALSVIFPELIRYSAISDYIEVKALEVLYVQYGSNYANFSIGLFQMKPTFAEQIEADIIALGLAGNYPSLRFLGPDTSATAEARKKRVIRLKDEYCQLLYLEAFLRIMDLRYPEVSSGSVEEKLAFCATAYNAGYRKGSAAIWMAINQACFHCGMIEPEVKYSYSNIARYFFLSNP